MHMYLNSRVFSPTFKYKCLCPYMNLSCIYAAYSIIRLEDTVYRFVFLQSQDLQALLAMNTIFGTYQANFHYLKLFYAWFVVQILQIF